MSRSLLIDTVEKERKGERDRHHYEELVNKINAAVHYRCEANMELYHISCGSPSVEEQKQKYELQCRCYEAYEAFHLACEQRYSPNGRRRCFTTEELELKCRLEKEYDELCHERKSLYPMGDCCREEDRERESELKRIVLEVTVEVSRMRQRLYHIVNPEKAKEKDRLYRIMNPEKVRASRRRRRVRERGVEGFHTEDEWLCLCEIFEGRCVACGLREELTRDHILPLSKGGTDYIGNIQPLCRSCNSRKSISTVDYRVVPANPLMVEGPQPEHMGWLWGSPR